MFILLRLVGGGKTGLWAGPATEWASRWKIQHDTTPDEPLNTHGLFDSNSFVLGCHGFELQATWLGKEEPLWKMLRSKQEVSQISLQEMTDWIPYTKSEPHKKQQNRAGERRYRWSHRLGCTREFKCKGGLCVVIHRYLQQKLKVRYFE